MKQSEEVEMDFDDGIKQALALARDAPSYMLYASRTEGSHALVHPADGGGVRMSGFDARGLAMSFCVFDQGGGSFDPERDLSDPSGYLWDAILGASTVEPCEKKSRLWESWVELFEAMPMVKSGTKGLGSPKIKL